MIRDSAGSFGEFLDQYPRGEKTIACFCADEGHQYLLFQVRKNNGHFLTYREEFAGQSHAVIKRRTEDLADELVGHLKRLGVCDDCFVRLMDVTRSNVDSIDRFAQMLPNGAVVVPVVCPDTGKQYILLHTKLADGRKLEYREDCIGQSHEQITRRVNDLIRYLGRAGIVLYEVQEVAEPAEGYAAAV
ncbi:MAG: hypothetical protein P4L33_00690 [Capsulimonadaceae bacterium]|nr:hypothetical protein [Capsulimonadaceae bacterium]